MRELTSLLPKNPSDLPVCDAVRRRSLHKQRESTGLPTTETQRVAEDEQSTGRGLVQAD